jgi:hypothetical protein
VLGQFCVQLEELMGASYLSKHNLLPIVKLAVELTLDLSKRCTNKVSTT